jgi:hypothetical protein
MITSSSNFLRFFRVVDLDNDGDKDVIGQRTYTQNLAIFHNDGAGNFGLPTYIDPPGFMYGFEVGDLDQDGDVDVMFTSAAPYVAWVENLGSGQFGDLMILDTTAYIPPDPFDLDLDGDMDLISGNGGGIILLENDGTQEFTASPYSPSITSAGCSGNTVSAPDGFVHADVNGDGLTDMLFGDFYCLGVYWVEGLADGTFGDAHFLLDLQADLQVEPVDLDADGDIDLAISDLDHFYLMENDGSGSFTTVATAPTSAAYLSTFVLRDCDNDGDKDFVRITNGHIDWLERTGPLSIGGYVSGPSIQTGEEYGYLVQADIIGSPAPELFYSNGTNIVAYFGDAGIGDGLNDLDPDPPHQVIVLGADGAVVRIAGPLVNDVHAFGTNGAEVRVNLEQTGTNSLIHIPEVSPGLYFVTYMTGSRRGAIRIMLAN